MWGSMLSVKVVKLVDLVAERRQSISETTDTGKSWQSWRELSSISSHSLSSPRVSYSTCFFNLSHFQSVPFLFWFPVWRSFHKSQLKEHYLICEKTWTWDCRMFCTVLVFLFTPSISSTTTSSIFSSTSSCTSSTTYSMFWILQLISAGVPAARDVLAEFHLCLVFCHWTISDLT